MRERAVHQNDNPILYIDRVIFPYPFLNNRCLSGPYLGNYKRD